MVNFYLRSIDHRTYKEKHQCVVRQVVEDNKILVDLVPPISRWVYNTDEDLHRVVLAPRYTNSSVTPAVSEWPCIVNVCVPQSSSNWAIGPWSLIDIGELIQS